TPGTVVTADPSLELRATSSPGHTALVELEVENRQRVHCVVAPAVTPLVAGSGTAWFPSAEFSPISALLGPGEVSSLQVRLSVPDGLPAGAYRGAIMLAGFRKAGVPVTITVTPKPTPSSTRSKTARDEQQRRPRRMARTQTRKRR